MYHQFSKLNQHGALPEPKHTSISEKQRCTCWRRQKLLGNDVCYTSMTIRFIHLWPPHLHSCFQIQGWTLIFHQKGNPFYPSLWLPTAAIFWTTTRELCIRSPLMLLSLWGRSLSRFFGEPILHRLLPALPSHHQWSLPVWDLCSSVVLHTTRTCKLGVLIFRMALKSFLILPYSGALATLTHPFCHLQRSPWRRLLEVVSGIVVQSQTVLDSDCNVFCLVYTLLDQLFSNSRGSYLKRHILFKDKCPAMRSKPGRPCSLRFINDKIHGYWFTSCLQYRSYRCRSTALPAM